MSHLLLHNVIFKCVYYSRGYLDAYLLQVKRFSSLFFLVNRKNEEKTLLTLKQMR